jgi:hypothetical protein
MALDYKTLQATELSQGTSAQPYCPECGRPWRELWPEHPRRSALVSWRAALLIVVGLALAITFGLRAAAAHQTEAATQRDLAELTLCLDGTWSGPGCPSVQDAEDWRAIDYGNVATARRQLSRALVATALGLLALGLGAASVARARRRSSASPRARSGVATAWQAGEMLLGLLCLQILTLYLDLVALQLSPGVPLGETLDRAAGDALAVIFRVSGT